MTTLTERRQSPRLARLVFLASGSLIALTAFSLLLLGYMASRTADQEALSGDRRLFDNALQSKLQLITRDQHNLARWDRTVANVVLTFDKAYVLHEMVDSLWNDFGHDRTWFIGAGGRVLAEASRDEVDFSGRMLPPGHDVRLVAEEATLRHMDNRIAIPGGYGQRAVHTTHLERIAATGFAMVDGRPAMVGAMAIVPDDGTVALPEGAPTILVSARYIDETLIEDLNAQLGFSDVAFSTAQPTGASEQAIVSVDNEPLGSFTWRAQTPGSRIWSTVIPLIALIAGTLAAVGLLVARRIGRLSQRLEDSESRNRHLASHDALTGLANRLRFDATLTAALERLPQTPFAVLACDLDRFKAVNDTYGHGAGDIVIRAVGERFRDVIGTAGLVARVGGDEFVALIIGRTDRLYLETLCRQTIAAVSAPIAVTDDATAAIGASIGIVTAQHAGTNKTTLLAAADEALYAAKSNGRGKSVFAEDLEDITHHAAPDERTPLVARLGPRRQD